MIIQRDLKSHFSPYILQCRPGDWEHAKRVVNWIHELAEWREDMNLLVIAGYIHDIGWSGLVPKDKKLTKEELLELQPLADKQTDHLVNEALTSFSLNDQQVNTIKRLIKATETYVAEQEDEQIVVDADNLSKTSFEHIKEKYAKSDWLSMCEYFEAKLPKRIQTKKGKSLLNDKLQELRQSVERELEIDTTDTAKS